VKVISAKFILGFSVIGLLAALFAINGALAQQTITEIGGYKLNVPLPGVPGAANPTTLAELTRYIYLWAMGVVALAAMIMLGVAGFKYFLAAGNPSRAEDAKDQATHALLGLIVVVGSYLILNTINPSLVNLGGAEQAHINKVVSSSVQGPEDQDAEGQCFASADLGTSGCGSVGNGWQNRPKGCSSACGTDKTCCYCNLGDSCETTQHSCAKKDSTSFETETYTGSPESAICGPYLRSDCGGKCVGTQWPTCVKGNLCNDPIYENISFKILYPSHPSQGNTVMPMSEQPGTPVFIAFEASDSVKFIEVRITDPNGIQVFTTTVAGSGGTQWTVPDPVLAGNYKLEAWGLDDQQRRMSGMYDSILMCFTCSGNATFTVASVAVSGTIQCSQNVFQARNGTAMILLDASGSSGFGHEKIGSYEWSDGDTQLGTANPMQAQTTASLSIGEHVIKLIAFGESSGTQSVATQTISIVEICQ
jgi:hypothetical protein